ncbi:MAG: hypothetical protein AB7V53_15750 [Dongiaceae bacterium]
MSARGLLALGSIFPGTIILAFLALIWPRFLPCELLYRLSGWQTLFAGLLALSGGAFVLVATHQQNESRRALDRERTQRDAFAAAWVLRAEAREIRRVVNEKEKILTVTLHHLTNMSPNVKRIPTPLERSHITFGRLLSLPQQLDRLTPIDRHAAEAVVAFHMTVEEWIRSVVDADLVEVEVLRTIPPFLKELLKKADDLDTALTETIRKLNLTLEPK